jgi:hypothetical protein
MRDQVTAGLPRQAAQLALRYLVAQLQHAPQDDQPDLVAAIAALRDALAPVIHVRAGDGARLVGENRA